MIPSRDNKHLYLIYLHIEIDKTTPYASEYKKSCPTMTTCQTAPTTYHVTVPTNPVGQYHWSTCLSERRRLNSQEVQLGVENFRLVCCWSRPRQQPWLNPTREIIWHRRMSGREKDFLIQNGRSSREKWAKIFFFHSFSFILSVVVTSCSVVRFYTEFQS